MKSVLIFFKGSLYRPVRTGVSKSAEEKAPGPNEDSDSLARWLESKNVEMEILYRNSKWKLTVTGPKNTVTSNGRNLNAVLAKGCQTFSMLISKG